MGIELHSEDDEPLFLRAADAYGGIPGGASGTSREDPSATVSAVASRSPARAPHSEGAGFDQEPAPFRAVQDDPRDLPGILLLELTAPAAIVVVATSTRIAISPDYAEEFGKQLIAAAGAARASKLSK